MTWIKAAANGNLYPKKMMSYAGEIIGALACTPDKAMDALDLAELTCHIVALHHRYVREALPGLDRYFEASAPEVRELFAAFRAQLVRLLLRDEEILFPRLVLLEEPGACADPARLAGVLAWLGSDHARLCANLRNLRERLRGADFRGLHKLRRGLADLAEDLDARMALQNEVLFPRALLRARQVRRSWKSATDPDSEL